MSAQTLPLSAQHFDKTANGVAAPAAEAAVKPQSLLQKAFAAWIKPYKNLDGFIPM